MTKIKRNVFAILIVAAIAFIAMGFAGQNVKARADDEDGFSATLSTVKYNVSKTNGGYTLLAATIATENMDRIYEVGFKAYEGETSVALAPEDAASKTHYYTTINGADSTTIFGSANALPMIVWKVETPSANVSYEAYVKYGYINAEDNNNLWSYATEKSAKSATKTAVTCYTVTIDEDGGNSVDDIVVPAGTPSSALGGVVVTKTGYHYSSWEYYDGAAWQALGDTQVNSDVTVRPVWVAIVCSVVFKDDNGDDIQNQNLAYGTAITAPTPTKAGYDLSWNTEVPATVTGDVTITAVWTARTDTAYTVSHLGLNAAGTDYNVVLDTDNLTGTTATQTAATANTYDLYEATAFSQETIAGDGTTVVEIHYDKKALGSTAIRYTRTGDNYVAEWDEVAHAESYEVKVDGETYAGYTSGTGTTISATDCKTLSVKAVNTTVGTEGAVAEKFLDVSYLTAKATNRYYLSNFNAADTENMWSQDSYMTGAWFANAATYTYQNAYGALTIQGGQSVTGAYIGSPADGSSNVSGTLYGVKFTKKDGLQASATYTLPEAFDLTGKGKLFIKTWQGVWSSNQSLYIMFVNGNKRLNVTGDALYAREINYNNENAATNTVNPGNYESNLNDANFFADMIVIDLTALLDTTAWSDVFGAETAITEIVIGINGGANKYYYLDEIYYSNFELEKANLSYAYSAGNHVVSWNAVDGAESYEVYLNGSAYAGYSSGTSATITSSGTVTVKAIHGKYNSTSDGLYVDASYMSSKGSGRVYLSDFNDSGTTALFTKYLRNQWETGALGDNMTIGHGTYTNPYLGSVTGITLCNNNVGTAAVKYNIPKVLDLNGKSKIVIRINSNNSWQEQYCGLYVQFVNGNTVLDILKYSHCIYNGPNCADDTQAPAAQLGSNNWPASESLHTATFVWDIAELLATADWTSKFGSDTTIDGIIIGIGKRPTTFYLDEIYYVE